MDEETQLKSNPKFAENNQEVNRWEWDALEKRIDDLEVKINQRLARLVKSKS